MEIKTTKLANKLFNDALEICQSYRHEFLMPEHVLYAMIMQIEFFSVLDRFCDSDKFATDVKKFLDKQESVPVGIDYTIMNSQQLNEMLMEANISVQNSDGEYIDVPHILNAMLTLENSWATYVINKSIGQNIPNFFSQIIDSYSPNTQTSNTKDEQPSSKDNSWNSYLIEINKIYKTHNPLIGREEELERTIQVLCRKDKNNPLFVGEPGVGKTSIIYGLTKIIEEKKVPKKLNNAKIYSLDIATVLAGTQYRGDFEKRIKQIMDGLEQNNCPTIVYIDEIHNLVGAGSTNEGSMDASNMLKPYLENDKLKFIGSTTYDEYNRYFSKSKGIVRRFQQIDISEPSVEQTIKILKGLQNQYEKYHNVSYNEDAIEYAAQSSAKYINDRFLPDKAIDLIDEAGAYREMHPLKQKRQTIDKKLINNILTKICKIDSIALKEDNNQNLKTLNDRISSQIFGQQNAVNQVVEAVQMSKAGLLDDNKPIASLLFVGPTGVGKTEVAKVLANELGISLIRFDMSEYTEKHTVAKLIGSPAGYVGYEDGGLLTDAIRKTPNCVLLLDEIEKAHSDIYNILLQVMDYAKLTDNKGKKADFKNVVLIMTSNAGAQYASNALVGFANKTTTGQAMMKEVKKTFKPEFINRLSNIVIFNDMDIEMAKLILNKKLNELKQKLTAKNISVTFSDNAIQFILKEGFTKEYGAREMDRVINQHIKPILMHEILFGNLQNGGNASIDFNDEKIIVKTN